MLLLRQLGPRAQAALLRRLKRATWLGMRRVVAMKLRPAAVRLRCLVFSRLLRRKSEKVKKSFRSQHAGQSVLKLV